MQVKCALLCLVTAIIAVSARQAPGKPHPRCQETFDGTFVLRDHDPNEAVQIPASQPCRQGMQQYTLKEGVLRDSSTEEVYYIGVDELLAKAAAPPQNAKYDGGFTFCPNDQKLSLGLNTIFYGCRTDEGASVVSAQKFEGCKPIFRRAIPCKTA